jgi:hypothetical protein
MNYCVYLDSHGYDYEVHVRGANIIHIIRHDPHSKSSHEISYDELPLVVREEILIAVLREIAKYVES